MPQPETLSLLFVDDDAATLSDLRVRIESCDERWNARFVTSGDEALRVLREERIDVVVTDMRMPGMDGTQLLHRAVTASPRTLRVALSEPGAAEADMRAIPVVHQWLKGPVAVDDLRAMIARTRGTLDLLRSDRVFDMLGGVGSLPTAPKLHQELVIALGDPDVEVDKVAAIVERDAGITARILQMSNSAFFAQARTVQTLRDAVGVLGFQMISHLVMFADLVKAMPKVDMPGFSPEGMQRRGVMVSRLAQEIAREPAMGDQAALAGLMHDLGKLILASEATDKFREALRTAANTGRPLHQVEMELFGATHVELGAAMLALWGLPAPVVDAVAGYFEPSDELDAMSPTVAVHVAHALIEDATAHGDSEHASNLSEALVERLRLGARLVEWRAMASSAIAGPGSAAA